VWQVVALGHDEGKLQEMKMKGGFHELLKNSPSTNGSLMGGVFVQLSLEGAAVNAKFAGRR
jgi:hypothetical protein